MYNEYLNDINNFFVYSNPTSVHILSFFGGDCTCAVIGQCFVLHPGPTHGNTKHVTYLPRSISGEIQAGAIHNLRDIDEKLIYNVPEIMDQNEASIIQGKS